MALYGVDRLIEAKQEEKGCTRVIMYSDVTREREELSEQIKALKELKELGKIYGFDISDPVFRKKRGKDIDCSSHSGAAENTV